MPVHKVKGGYKFGKSGKTYRGKGAKKKAEMIKSLVIVKELQK